jgi:hypothetical protein
MKNETFSLSTISHHQSVLGGSAPSAGPIAERMSDVLSESRASSLVKGFENASPAQALGNALRELHHQCVSA